VCGGLQEPLRTLPSDERCGGFDWNANKKTGENPLFSAIMNSVDWEELLEDVKKDLDVE
jgi:hypothetical protein